MKYVLFCIALMFVINELLFSQTKDSINIIPIKKHGHFSNITEVGGLFGFGNISYKSSIENTSFKNKNSNKFVSVTTINGYQFNRNFFLGIGIGIECPENIINMPIFADIRIDLLKKKVTPFLDFGVGYAVRAANIKQKPYFQKGDVITNTQIGIKINIVNHFSWILGLGYRFQYNRQIIKFTDTYGLLIGTGPVETFSNYLILKTGFVF